MFRQDQKLEGGIAELIAEEGKRTLAIYLES
jgi:hypothetical protein